MAPARTASLLALIRALRGATRPGEPQLREHVAAVPRLVRATLRGEYHGTTRARLGSIALAVLYVASPVDVLPEVLLGVAGLVDDAVVLSFVVTRVLGETGSFLAWERSRPGAPRRGPQKPPSDDVIPGEVLG